MFNELSNGNGSYTEHWMWSWCFSFCFHNHLLIVCFLFNAIRFCLMCCLNVIWNEVNSSAIFPKDLTIFAGSTLIALAVRVLVENWIKKEKYTNKKFDHYNKGETQTGKMYSKLIHESQKILYVYFIEYAHCSLF